LFLKLNKDLEWGPFPEAPKALAKEIKEIASCKPAAEHALSAVTVR